MYHIAFFYARGTFFIITAFARGDRTYLIKVSLPSQHATQYKSQQIQPFFTKKKTKLVRAWSSLHLGLHLELLDQNG